MDFIVSGNAPLLFPVETFFGLLYCSDEDVVEIPYQYPLQGEWGNPLSSVFDEPQNRDIPSTLDLVYLSIIEEKFYSLEEDIPIALFKRGWDIVNKSVLEEGLPYIIVGFAPYGLVTLWIYEDNKSVLVSIFHAVETEVSMSDFYPSNCDIQLKEICQRYINNNSLAQININNNGLPPRDLFDRYMQQFMYKYNVNFGHWDEGKREWKGYEEDEIKPKFDYIEEALFDGTHDKLHDGGLMKYHEAGKPKKLALQWHIKKSDYSAYLWFDDIAIRSAFEQFYYKYSEAKMDFTFHIDTAKKVFQLSLNCDEAEEPMPLSEDSYQMIIFKSKFEYYRTANYNQPRGAWIW